MKQIRILMGIICLPVVMLLPVGLWAVPVPSWTGPVNDTAGIMSETEKMELTEYLTALNDQTGVQIAVLTVPSLEGEPIETFSLDVAEAWKLGQADTDNGALLVVSLDDRELRIETGYGLEPLLTDVKCGLIIRNVIAPYFRSGDYGAGIIAGIRNMAGVATDNAELVAEAVQDDGESSADIQSIIVAVIFFAVFFSIVTAGAASAYRDSRSGKRIIKPTLMGGTGGVFRSGSSGGSSGFRGGRSSGFSGGFRGGGGGFGGGGASGKW